LALAGGGSVRAGIRGRAAVRLGFRVDGSRHACAGCPAEAAGRGGLLPPRAESHVRGLRGGMGRTVSRLRARQLGGDCCRHRSRKRRALVRGLLRGAGFAQEVRRGLRRVLPKRKALAATAARVE